MSKAPRKKKTTQSAAAERSADAALGFTVISLPDVPLTLQKLIHVAMRQPQGERIKTAALCVRLVKEYCIVMQDFETANELRTAQRQLDDATPSEQILIASEIRAARRAK